jgi:hypothetical protein
MTAIIEELRGLCEAGSAEYTLGTTVYWGDDVLQDMLDSNRIDLIHEQLIPRPIVVGGTVSAPIRYPYYQFKKFETGYAFLENTTGGTDVFYLQDGTGSTLGTALWSADYRRGIVNFVNDTLGTAIYYTGSAYDLNATASDVWRNKAAHYAPSSFNFSTDNHSISRAQVYEHAVEMTKFFENISGNSIQTLQRFRSDM